MNGLATMMDLKEILRVQGNSRIFAAESESKLFSVLASTKRR
jgi:hypothetical protein